MMLKPISFLRKASGGGGGVETLSFIDGVSSGLVTDATTIDLDFTSVGSGDPVRCLLVKANGTQGTGITDLDCEGTTLGSPTDSTSTSSSRVKAYLYSFNCPAAAAGNANVTFTGTMTGGNHWGIGAWLASGTPTTETVAKNQYTDNTDPLVASPSAVDGGTVISIAIQEGSSGSFTWPGGFTENADFLNAGTNDLVSFVTEQITSTGTHTTTATHGSTGHGAILSLAVS